MGRLLGLGNRGGVGVLEVAVVVVVGGETFGATPVQLLKS